MKKNNMLRIASVLLVAVLLSTCAISGAFAKYSVDATQYTDAARVAKFGITVSTNAAADELFVAEEGTTPSLTVKSTTADDMVAPGMEGDLTAAIAITDSGREVAVAVKVDATLTLSDNWKDGADAFYCPIVITIGTEEVSGLDFTSAAEFIAAVEAELDNGTNGVTYYCGQDASAASIPAIAWEWAFDGDDVKDTALGEAGVGTISLTIDVSIDQVD